MNKVYIVSTEKGTCGSHSFEVFSNREKAENYVYDCADFVYNIDKEDIIKDDYTEDFCIFTFMYENEWITMKVVGKEIK